MSTGCVLEQASTRWVLPDRSSSGYASTSSSSASANWCLFLNLIDSDIEIGSFGYSFNGLRLIDMVYEWALEVVS
jgi:hypothetical protein